MATCGDVITNALKLAKVLPSGASPTAEETADGMLALQSLYDGWVAGAMFGRLEDIYLDADDTAEEGKRYFVPTGTTLTAATSTYTDADGNPRQPRDLALYESLTEAGTRSVKLYDRTAWVELTGLTTASDAPLASRGLMGLAACLALSGAFSSMFGGQATPEIVNLARIFQAGLSYKPGSTRDRTVSEYF